MKNRRGLALVAFVVFAQGCSSSAHENVTTSVSRVTDKPAFGSGGSGVAIFLEKWKWNDVAANMGAIAASNYTAVLLSPHTATCSGAFGGAGYDPSDFTSFDGGFGSQGDLQNAINTAHGAGVQVYANMILNHMCTHPDYSYADFSWNDFHHNGDIQNWSDQSQLENDDLFGLNDLAQESDYVRGQLFNYVVKTNDMGFDGYRWDAAKHVPIWYWRDHVLNNVDAWGKYNFGEVFDANLDYQQGYVDAGMAVTDYNLYYAMQSAFTFGGDLSALDGAGMAIRNGAMALTFVENQDVGAAPNRLLAYAFITGYPGYPMFSNVDVRDQTFANLAWVHRNRAYGAYVNRWKEHDVLIFERQGNLVVGLNQSGDWQSRWIDTSWSSTPLHDYSGHTGDVGTSGDARLLVSIPPGSYVMLAQ